MVEFVLIFNLRGGRLTTKGSLKYISRRYAAPLFCMSFQSSYYAFLVLMAVLYDVQLDVVCAYIVIMKHFHQILWMTCKRRTWKCIEI